ncbi:MAG TPA: arylsulfotransferase family protein [Gaiellaceae bacterium]|nr:arylsulfotransferase family protein [Gaiellaceae bacterium]
MRAAVLLVPCLLVLVGCGIEKKAVASTAAKPATTVTLHTLPDFHPPILRIDDPAKGTAAGYVMFAQKGGKDRPSGVVIADDKGRIVWYHEVPKGLEATDFRAQTYRGKPVLTWWQGIISKAGIGRGSYVVYDASYEQIATFKAAHGLDGDLHEFQLTPRGTAYISVYHEVPVDLRSVGGPKNGYAEDSVVQEIDIKTGKVVFEWRSLDHVPLTESIQANREPAHHATKKRPLDYFHINSIADGPRGTILISGRNTSALYLLRRDGSIVWRLGGKRSDFGPAAAVMFRYQHNARFHGASTISLFDNGATPKEEPYTRPLVLHIDAATKTARVVKTFVHPKKLSSPFEGNLELLPGGGAFVGWGGIRKLTEFSPTGKIRFQMTLPYGDTYRGYRLPWSGSPGGKPLVSVDGDRVYASWNGKRGIARWQVLSGADADHLSVISSRPWSGLETTIGLETPPKTVAVRALDAAGHTLGRSETLTP